jgi:hypothetical protein
VEAHGLLIRQRTFAQLGKYDFVAGLSGTWSLPRSRSHLGCHRNVTGFLLRLESAGFFIVSGLSLPLSISLNALMMRLVWLAGHLGLGILPLPQQ